MLDRYMAAMGQSVPFNIVLLHPRKRVAERGRAPLLGRQHSATPGRPRGPSALPLPDGECHYACGLGGSRHGCPTAQKQKRTTAWPPACGSSKVKGQQRRDLCSLDVHACLRPGLGGADSVRLAVRPTWRAAMPCMGARDICIPSVSQLSLCVIIHECTHLVDQVRKGVIACKRQQACTSPQVTAATGLENGRTKGCKEAKKEAR